MTTLNLNPWTDTGKIQRRFILSKELEICLMAPRGEGKTEAGIRRMTLMSAEQPEESRPIPWALLRDTWTNLERTTVKSLLFPHPDSFAAKIRPLLQVRENGRYISLPGLWDLMSFGMDSLGDLSRLQSLQLGGLWLEEPAPAAAEDIGGGLEERVVTVGITSLRHPCTWRTVQVTSNYPDEDHWTWQRYSVNRIGRLLRIPRGENPHLPSNYRTDMEKALVKDVGLLNRLVLGLPGFVSQGEAVTPEYNPLVHRTETELEPYPNVVGYRFWDGYSNPACIICQLTPRGQLHVYESIVGKGMGVKQLIREFVRPAMKERYSMIPEWEDIGDPSMQTKDQSDYEQSAATVVEKELGSVFRGGPGAWKIRQQGVKNALLEEIHGPTGKKHPFILLSGSPLVQPLHNALRGGWCYRLAPSGLRVGTVPMKNLHSHPGDALSYGVCELLSMSEGGYIDPYVQPTADPYVENMLLHRALAGSASVGRDQNTGY